MTTRILILASLACCVSIASASTLAWSQDSKKPEKIDKDAPWDLPDSRYLDRVEKMDPHDKKSGELRVKVRVIPDALYYFMGRECEELEEAGYDDKTLARKLRTAYLKYKAQKNRVLFLITVTGATSTSRPFYVSDPKKHLSLKAKKKGTVGLVEQNKKPDFKIFQIYQYIPNAPRKVGKKKLALAKDHDLLISSRSVRSDKRDPITLSIGGLLLVKSVKGGKGDEGLGLNERFDQISMYRWSDQIMPPLNIRIYPSKWKIPKPPKELVRIVRRLEGR